jgi:aspartokinase-like uncharacterized kinase
MSRNQCLLRYGQVLKKLTYLKARKKILEPVHRIAAAEDISVLLVWRILREQSHPATASPHSH